MFDQSFLFKVCKIINYILIFFSNKINHNKIYYFYKNILNTMNGQMHLKKSPMITIKIHML
jgi:hypothetical protein